MHGQGMDKIMETLHIIGIYRNKAVLAALKEH
jgi:hypothetical protein